MTEVQPGTSENIFKQLTLHILNWVNVKKKKKNSQSAINYHSEHPPHQAATRQVHAALVLR